MIPFLPLLAGAVLGADFPSDTLLPYRRVETRVSTGAVEEGIRYDYARDARDCANGRAIRFSLSSRSTARKGASTVSSSAATR